MPNTPDQMVGHRIIITSSQAVHKKADAEVIRSQNQPENLTVSVFTGLQSPWKHRRYLAHKDLTRQRRWLLEVSDRRLPQAFRLTLECGERDSSLPLLGKDPAPQVHEYNVGCPPQLQQGSQPGEEEHSFGMDDTAFQPSLAHCSSLQTGLGPHPAHFTYRMEDPE